MDAEAYVDMLPWILFVVIDRKTGLGVVWAGGCGAVCAAGLLAWSLWLGRRSLTSWVALVVFSGCVVLGLAVGSLPPHTTAARAVVVGILGLTAFVSLRYEPLSCTYTGAHIRPAAREDPGFDHVNVQITRAWGIGAMVAAGAYCIPLWSQTSVAYTLSDWVAPLVIAAVTIKWTADRWEHFRLDAHTEAATQAASTQPLAAVINGSPPVRPRQDQDAVIRTLEPRSRRNA